MEGDKVERVKSTVSDYRSVSFVTNEAGEMLAHIEKIDNGYVVSIYEEPAPPPATMLAMNTRNECLAALTGWREAHRCLEEE